MDHSTPIMYKIAEKSNEMDQIHRLNYETFVEEIPQHKSNEERKLIDRFDDDNVYIIAKNKDEVVGMISVRGNRPFSLDQKLKNLDTYLSKETVPCEIRLLSIKEAYRGGRIFYGLCEQLVSYCLEKGYTVALISGTVQQTKLYKHIGFQAFGPPVGTEEASYQPMYLTKERFELSSRVFQRLMEREEKAFNHNFLPGPVEVIEEVRKAWKKPAISHRSLTLQSVMNDVQIQLCDLANANYAEVVVGTGTLANDMVAAQLSTFSSKGLILANGEFGERLIDHGSRWNLPFKKIHKSWNTPIRSQEVDDALKSNPDIQWIWTVHSETSTGYIYPLEDLKRVCQKHNVSICVDACSSVGVIPVDYSDVYLASTVSGKGLGSYPGLAIVFHRDKIFSNEKLPNYLDIGEYQINNSLPYTHSSNGLLALREALRNPHSEKEELARIITHDFTASGMSVLRGEGYSPGIITVSLPERIASKDFGDRLKSCGIQISYESGYLLKRNWFQVALMGDQDRTKVMTAIRVISEQYEQMMTERVTDEEDNYLSI